MSLWILIDHPEQSVPFLREKVKPAIPLTEARVAQLIADLDSDTFRTRDTAERTLRGYGDSVRAAMTKALQGNAKPEQRSRLERLLRQLDADPIPPLTDEQIPLAWAVAALERIGTPEARAILKDVAGYPPGRLSAEANAALSRLSGGAR